VLSLALRLLRPELSAAAAGRLDAADAELRRALAELRDLARGIYPAVLADDGLDAALAALAEAGRTPMIVERVPSERLPAAIEAATYFLIAEITKRNGTGTVTVSADRADRRLLVEIDATTLDEDLVELEDRIGALDGELTVERTPSGHATIRAVLPCAS
jgi:signal transduction histidine kinase